MASHRRAWFFKEVDEISYSSSRMGITICMGPAWQIGRLVIFMWGKFTGGQCTANNVRFSHHYYEILNTVYVEILFQFVVLMFYMLK